MRFSLSPTPSKGTTWASYRDKNDNYNEDCDDDESLSSKDTFFSSSSDETSIHPYSDDDEDDPHPLGFSSNESYGITRFGLVRPRHEKHWRQHKDQTQEAAQNYGLPENNSQHNDEEEGKLDYQATSQRRPCFHFHESKQTSSLLRHHYRCNQSSHFLTQQRGKGHHLQNGDDYGDNDDPLMDPLITNMDRIGLILRSATALEVDHPTTIIPSLEHQNQAKIQACLTMAATRQLRAQEEVQARSKAYEAKILQEQVNAAQILLSMIQRDAAEDQLFREKEEEREVIDQELIRKQEEVARKREEELLRKQEEEARKQEEERQEKENEARIRKEREKELEKKRLEQKRVEKEKVDALNAKKMEHITIAQKFVDELRENRKILKEFDETKEKIISKRRLGMKRISRGKLNTLKKDEGKIQSVANDIVSEINNCAANDESIEREINQGNNRLSVFMTKGKNYLMDLIASSCIIRVQADGFNGTRGDAFPLANMLANISTSVSKSFIEFWTGHLYDACSLAIPVLCLPAPNCSEEELMDTIGMKKDKDGEYEKFEKFLARTEGLISIMADIMCSTPTNHRLLGGCEGALKWLKRFLDLLHKDLCPLPIVTAPTLVAFLTAAGHMLAMVFESEFRPMLDLIINDISKRLDTTPIGQPSATRLNKLLSGGFDDFKKTLPPGAVKNLYNTIGIVDTQTTAQPTSLGVNNHAPQPSPFGPAYTASEPTHLDGGGSNMLMQNSFESSPFSSSSNTMLPPSFSTVSMSSPFGGGNTNASASSPFGGGNTNAPAKSPFGGGNTNAPATSPFGGGNNSISAPSPFGGGNNNISAPSPFGGGNTNAPAQSPFGPAPSPFGGPGNLAPAQTPFGGPANNIQQQTPFGTSNHIVSTQSPFGGSAMQSTAGTNPFSRSDTKTTFSGLQPTSTNSFNGGGNNSQTPFGTTISTPFQAKDDRPLCKYFALGKCRNGDNCKFSHNTTSSTSTFGQSSNNNTTPFGRGCVPVTSKIPCKWFAKGMCRFGSKCKYSHETTGTSGNENSGGFGFGGKW